MGYNFPCAHGCTLKNSHIGPCDALSDEERMAQAILDSTYVANGFCIHCGAVPGIHIGDCICLVARKIMDQREASLQFLKRGDISQ